MSRSSTIETHTDTPHRLRTCPSLHSAPRAWNRTQCAGHAVLLTQQAVSRGDISTNISAMAPTMTCGSDLDSSSASSAGLNATSYDTVIHSIASAVNRITRGEQTGAGAMHVYIGFANGNFLGAELHRSSAPASYTISARDASNGYCYTKYNVDAFGKRWVSFVEWP